MEQEQNTNEWEMIREVSINNTAQLYPMATKEEVERYVDEFMRFEKFLMDKYNKSIVEATDIIIDALQKSMTENVKQQVEITKDLEQIENGYIPEMKYADEELENMSSCLRKLAIQHDYPHVQELITVNKILENYLIKSI
jgi:hypothetical protein